MMQETWLRQSCIESFHAVQSCRSVWLNRSLLFSLCKWMQMNANNVFACPTILPASCKGTQKLETTTMQYTIKTMWFQPKPSNQIAAIQVFSEGNGKWRWWAGMEALMGLSPQRYLWLSPFLVCLLILAWPLRLLSLRYPWHAWSILAHTFWHLCWCTWFV